jgi:hypothetical protein
LLPPGQWNGSFAFVGLQENMLKLTNFKPLYKP